MSETTAPAATETPAPQPTSNPAPAAADATLLTPGAGATRDASGRFQPTTPAADPAAPAIPEKYEFAAPVIDGKPIEVDPAALGSFEAAAREAGMTQEQFAKIAPLGAQMIATKVQEAIAAALPQHLAPATQESWIDAVKNDVEIGGTKLAASIANAAKAIDAYGSNELRQALELTRAGNHPAVVKFFAKIGAAMGEPGNLLTGRPAPGKPTSGEQAARNFYNDAGGSYTAVES